jgi:hypothetical protein
MIKERVHPLSPSGGKMSVEKECDSTLVHEECWGRERNVGIEKVWDKESM